MDSNVIWTRVVHLSFIFCCDHKLHLFTSFSTLTIHFMFLGTTTPRKPASNPQTWTWTMLPPLRLRVSTLGTLRGENENEGERKVGEEWVPFCAVFQPEKTRVRIWGKLGVVEHKRGGPPLPAMPASPSQPSQPATAHHFSVPRVPVLLHDLTTRTQRTQRTRDEGLGDFVSHAKSWRRVCAIFLATLRKIAETPAPHNPGLGHGHTRQVGACASLRPGTS